MTEQPFKDGDRVEQVGDNYLVTQIGWTGTVRANRGSRNSEFVWVDWDGGLWLPVRAKHLQLIDENPYMLWKPI